VFLLPFGLISANILPSSISMFDLQGKREFDGAAVIDAWKEC